MTKKNDRQIRQTRPLEKRTSSVRSDRSDEGKSNRNC